MTRYHYLKQKRKRVTRHVRIVACDSINNLCDNDMKKIRSNFCFIASKNTFIKKTDSRFLNSWHRQYKFNRFPKGIEGEVSGGIYP
jgi:hypothetical protein